MSLLDHFCVLSTLFILVDLLACIAAGFRSIDFSNGPAACSDMSALTVSSVRDGLERLGLVT